MSRLFSTLDAAIGGVVRWIILPVTGVIPVLVRTGLLFAGFAVLWAALVGAMFLRPDALDAAWAWLTSLALPAQALLWLAFLPLTGALWAWSFDWPVIVRVAIVLGIAAWNLLAFRPQRGSSVTSASPATAEA
jgi:hypothetical protein